MNYSPQAASVAHHRLVKLPYHLTPNVHLEVSGDV